MNDYHWAMVYFRNPPSESLAEESAMAQGRKTQLTILLTPKERQTLESWQRSTTICHGQARRARIILLLADRVPISEIARCVGVARGPM